MVGEYFEILDSEMHKHSLILPKVSILFTRNSKEKIQRYDIRELAIMIILIILQDHQNIGLKILLQLRNF